MSEIPAVSSCCFKPVFVAGDGSTRYFACERCKKACDIAPPEAEAIEEFKRAILEAIEPVCRPVLDFLARVLRRFSR